MAKKLRYTAMHVGARSRYGREGGMSVEVDEPFAMVIGSSDSLEGASDLIGAYWARENSPYRGSMIEHLIIVDSTIQKGNANVLTDNLWKKVDRKWRSKAEQACD